MSDVVALGDAARVPLETLLTEREPSGIYQPRILAARALGAIHANDILLEFLQNPRLLSDAVERAGEEAVMNGAAEVLAQNRFEAAFETLRAIVAARPHLIGTVHALAAFGRAAAIPELVTALGDDGSRHAAEEGLRRLGLPASRCLLDRLERLAADQSRHFETNVRHRHAILAMLLALGLPPGGWPVVVPFMNDPDERVSAAACGIALVHGPPIARYDALKLLQQIARTADLRLRIEIDEILKCADADEIEDSRRI
ncbi:hypothetical protein PX554_20540 [Sphingomonas sp. H39-1-10]|uniref:hypothetical protein n=1 Tax=Sphingomonas pollutisoli TaxID=3030829 RepID=UPI0023B9BD55|nr:hypothetical protein [Sphingomonas pollutisoli]MDF0490523.1 hypothetical protein [Sphingomonas pollutisoli]